jgi:hypothetical protein
MRAGALAADAGGRHRGVAARQGAVLEIGCGEALQDASPADRRATAGAAVGDETAALLGEVQAALAGARRSAVGGSETA